MCVLDSRPCKVRAPCLASEKFQGCQERMRMPWPISQVYQAECFLKILRRSFKARLSPNRLPRPCLSFQYLSRQPFSRWALGGGTLCQKGLHAVACRGSS